MQTPKSRVRSRSRRSRSRRRRPCRRHPCPRHPCRATHVGGAAHVAHAVVADAVHAGEHGVHQQERADAPRTGHERGLPPRLGVPATRHRAPRDHAAGVVVRRARTGLRRGGVLVALDGDPAVLADGTGLGLAGDLGQRRTGVHAHGLTGRADVVQALHRGLRDQPGLRDRAGLLHLRPGGGEALGRVGHRLRGGGVRTGEAHHLPAQPLDPAARFGLGVVELPRLTRFALVDQVEHAGDQQHQHNDPHDGAHGLPPTAGKPSTCERRREFRQKTSGQCGSCAPRNAIVNAST